MTGAAARADACAKLNLRLKVFARDATGFHALETLFVRIALADEVTVRVRERGQAIEMSGEPELVARSGPAERNLALRAAAAFAEITGWPRGFAIEIHKQIPIGAGLGGGSADAAAVLSCLHALTPAPCSERELLRIAGSLGADVPFLLCGAPMALAWGRGDRMLSVAPLPERDVILLTPSIAIPTAEAYAWLDSARGPSLADPVAIPADALASWPSVTPFAENDFEPVVTGRHPEIAELHSALTHAGARIARLSGSGSTVFGIFDEAVDPSRLALPDGARARSTKTLTSVVRAERIG